MRVGIACDHAGFPHKAPIAAALRADGHAVTDLGTDSTDAVDYPDYARILGDAVRGGTVEAGVLICGSGAGAAIAANKLRGIRAALCHDLFTARQSREDDDANVLCLGARVIDADTAVTLTRAFLAARFSGAERHRRRVAKIAALETAECGVAGLVRPLPVALRARVPVAGGGEGGELVSDPAVDQAMARLSQLDAGRRMWAQDTSLWSSDPAVRAAVKNRLAWLTAPATMRARPHDLAAFAAEARKEGVADVVLLGMGGSSLAPEVLAATFGAAPGAPRLTVLDTTDPVAIRAVSERLDLRRALFIVASKSGTTTESNSLYQYFRHEVDEAKVEQPGWRFVAITDAGTPLERLARDAGFRRTFINDAGIGGRFSALSYFGLVPGALLGVDIEALLARASAMGERCGPDVSVADNPGLALGAALGGFAQAGRDKVTLVLAEPLRSLGAWLEQLITESTGKQGKGLVVISGEPLGAPAVYAADRVFVSITLGEDAVTERMLDALGAAGHPVIRLSLDDRLDIGGEFLRWEIATAAVGIVLGLNPFDEPNVAQAKEATQAALATYRDTGELPQWPPDGPDDVATKLAESRPGDYVALLAYLTPTDATTAALQSLRTLLRDRTRLATTVGYGPRYLHSTGQLHKGGPPTPILVILTQKDSVDVPIPGEPFTFGTLKMAQALGDLATLRAAQRRALWLPLDGSVAEAIHGLAATLGSRLDPGEDTLMDVGFVGLGRMGGNMVTRLVRDGHRIVAYDPSANAANLAAANGAELATTLGDFATMLKAPRAVWVMVPAGAPTETTVQALAGILSKGDTIIDGGNTKYKDDVRRGHELAGKGIDYVDAGTSGGIWGLQNGYCLMVGGGKAPVQRLAPLFTSLAPPDGWLHTGGIGSGHYVKMIHNGIEYAMMQAYAEGFELMEVSDYGLDLPAIAKLWNQGSVVRSWLLELTADALAADPKLAGLKPYVEDSGEGRWTVEDAVEKAVPAPTITAALFARFRSRRDNSYADRLLAAMRNAFGGHAVRR